MVALIVNRREIFPDNWIYIHDPTVKMGRIQNFKNWSPQMVADAEKTCLGLEYFCFEGDGLWTMRDEDLIALAKSEIEKVCLVKACEVEDGVVIRVPKAYPVYDQTYKESLKVVRAFLDRLENLQLVGRNGMHKYNNQDHSMLTAMLAVKNILGARYDLWAVNTEQEYMETSEEDEAGQYRLLASTQPIVPQRIAALRGASAESEL
jgi:protoporphyrinogen oxidase